MNTLEFWIRPINEMFVLGYLFANGMNAWTARKHPNRTALSFLASAITFLVIALAWWGLWMMFHKEPTEACL